MTRAEKKEELIGLFCTGAIFIGDLIDECFEFGQQHPRWISVEDDGNPIDTGWYIFTTGKIVDVGYYLGGNEWRDVHPTHWMPRPAPPKEIKGNLEKISPNEKGDNE